MCGARDLVLVPTGLDASLQNQAVLSVGFHEIRRHAAVSKDFRVLPDAFRTFCRADSVAAAGALPPHGYDAINLDLCDSLCERNASGLPGRGDVLDNDLQALGQLVAVQLKRRALPWLLFVTTRIDSDTVDPRSMDHLQEVLDSNLADEDFKAVHDAKFGERSADPDKSFADRFVLGVSKWLARLVVNNQHRLELSSAAVYRVPTPQLPAVPNMASLVLRVFRTPPTGADPAKLSAAAGFEKPLTPQQQRQREIDVAIQAAIAYDEREDVDDLMIRSDEEYDRCKAETVDLLGRAGFSRPRVAEYCDSTRDGSAPSQT